MDFDNRRSRSHTKTGERFTLDYLKILNRSILFLHSKERDVNKNTFDGKDRYLGLNLLAPVISADQKVYEFTY